MNQSQAVHTFHSAWDRPRAKRGARGVTAAAMIIAAAHGLLIFYLYKSKIEPHYAPPQDGPVVITRLFHPQTPPPPPPPPRPSQPLKSASALRPHIANPPPADITQPDHLPLPPVQQSQDTVGVPQPTQATPSQPPVLINPQFDRIPNADDMAQYYPERASRLGKQGDATIRCTVSAKGALNQCLVVRENPTNLGFGDAALKLAKLFKLKPATADGVPVDGGVFSTKISFKLPE